MTATPLMTKKYQTSLKKLILVKKQVNWTTLIRKQLKKKLTNVSRKTKELHGASQTERSSECNKRS